jgi:general secretion pathway protein G
MERKDRPAMSPASHQEPRPARAGDIRPRLASRRAGFTLIEVILVLALIGLLAGISAIPMSKALDRVRVARAIAEISTIQKEISLYETERSYLPNTLADVGRGGLLDPWGRPYQYVKFVANGGGGGGNGGGNGGGGNGGGGGGGGGGGIAGQARKDRFLVPINSTYDLYSVGADGQTALPLTAKHSHDDVIRGNDGSYIGLAAGY